LDEKTLEFLKKELPEIYAYIDPENDTNTEKTAQKSDEVPFAEELPSVKNKKVQLLYSLCRVEYSSARDKILDVSHAAADADDFVTALYWHEKLSLVMPQDISLKFERYFYSLLAAEQKKKAPDAKPITSAQQLLQHRSETSRTLKDPKYPEIEARYLEKKTEVYRQRFLSDSFENTTLRSVQKKKSGLDNFGCLFMLLCWGAGGFGLWKTIPIVWNWMGNALLQLIGTAFYIVVFLVVTLFISTLFSSQGDKKLKKFFQEQKAEIDESLRRSEEYLALQKMNEGLPEDYRSYPKRMVLATLSAMTGETNLRKLCDLAEKGEYTWLSGDCAIGSYNRNKRVLSLAREGATDADLAKAFVLYERSAVGRERSYLLSAKTEEPDFISRAIRACNTMLHGETYKGEVIQQPFNHLYDLPLRFLKTEYETACRGGNRTYIGEVCYRLYDMGIRCYDHAVSGRKDMHDIAYHYGILGVKYSDKLKFRVMNEYAVYDETRNGKLSLGFFREDAEDYCKELYRKGDPRWREMQKALDSAKKRDEDFIREREFREAREERAAQLAELRRQEEEKQARRRELEKRADLLEREVDLMRGGSGHTVEELRIGGKVSDVDAMHYKDLRDHVIDKKNE